MIKPTTVELVRAVRASLEEEVFSTLTDAVAVSYARSVRYLLAQIEVRIELEPAIYGQHNVDLRHVLSEVAVMLERKGSIPDIGEVAIFIRRELAETPATRSNGTFGALLAEVAGLRQILVDVSKRVGAVADCPVNSEVELVRRAIFAFVERDFAREAALYEGSSGNDAY